MTLVVSGYLLRHT